MKFNLIALLFFAFCFVISAQAQTKTSRFIAVTIDDLPVVSTRGDLKTRREITKNLLAHITKAKVPAVGFVNENKLYASDKPNETQIDLLRSWLDADLELGNHTFSHRSLNNIELKDYQNDILRGEIITKKLMRAKGKTLRFFRHPYLQTGLNSEIKDGLNEFLFGNGYTIAPVTIDNADWIFARAYDNAFDKKDKNLMRKIGAAYVPYLESKMDYWERQSLKLFDREIKQILLLHAHFINSDYFDDIAEMLGKRGYKFITLEEALKDESYKLPDTFNKRAGISWLHRWALAKGRENVLPDEPKTPNFVMKAAGVDSE
ncbi:MAG TPA: polysaccharide deacetylase family protein [Pyrinomonadaceae bacterium]|nr:polysaccharide deacetylase family protein [Pyrinomonadaceae bacterium]